MFHRNLFIFVASSVFIFLAWCANAQETNYTIELRHIYYCDPELKGDCSREGLYFLEDELRIVAYPNDDPEFGCDDTSCECYWQECYND